MVYYYTKEDTSYLNYFINQVKSLDNAFKLGEYDKEDNGVYEYFRAGYRVFNWLFVHNAYLASDNYDWRDQILLIKTLLHTGAQLQNKTKRFRFGNHHTKGLCSLFQLSVLFPEFYGIDIWMKQSVEQLTLHLQKEINDDGFQFERSVHYHIGDIENYFYVFQLAKINDIKLPVDFTDKLRSMFDALVKIAQPNKRLPVLQDDTDEPWAEFNQLDNIMTIGAILFQDKIYRYFASDNIPSNYYWLIRPSDAKIIYEEKGEQPAIGSTALNSTGYYVMRNGWKSSNQYMIISAGLSKEKPDHQHGDMLGVAAYSNGNEILPNYQVRYFLNDFEFFKNSWVKNVALVDSLPQGRNWQPNSGGSGFGKWKVQPKPKTLAWYSNDGFDYFAGTHNGYDSSGVKYNREILFIKDGFWIVKDNFESGSPHSYQQIWQGHYGIENNHHLRSTFSNSSGLEIIQLKDDDYKINSDGWHGKQNFVFNVSKKNNYSFTTLLYPFKYFGYIINDETQNDSLSFFNWTILKHIDQKFSDAKFIVSNNGNLKIFIDAKFITLNNHKLMFDKSSTFYVKQKNENFEITLLGKDSVDTVNEYNLKFIPGKKIVLNMKR